MKKLIWLAILLPTMALSAQDDTGKFMEGLMVVSKTTGLCGALHQMTVFQNTTKMEGGDAFMERFLQTEAARLGIEPAEFALSCNTIIAKYNQYLDIYQGK